jgi:hypothetical protein
MKILFANMKLGNLIMSDRTVKIICHHVIYNCLMAHPKPYQHPRALNWRYQVPGENYNQSSKLNIDYQKPRAINWRWQSANFIN